MTRGRWVAVGCTAAFFVACTLIAVYADHRASH